MLRMTPLAFGTLLCFIVVCYCDSKEITKEIEDTSSSEVPQPKTWYFYSNPTRNEPTEDETEEEQNLGVIEEDVSIEVETIRPLVLNPNATFEHYQTQPNKKFLDWLFNLWSVGNNNNQSINNNNNNNKPIIKDCSACTCGITNTLQRIVGGVVTKVNQWPWVVALKNNNQFYCGGSLVSSRYVLTAAHCTVGVSKERILAVFLEHDRSDPSETATFTRKISNIFRHIRYNANAHYNNDISLLRLVENVPFNDKVKPVCLPALEHSYAGSVGTVTGWGATAEYAATSQLLREVNVPIMTNNDCRKTKYGDKISNNMLCAGFVGKGGKDACQGDSGGPLHVANGTKYMIVGIVSWGEGCAEREYPGVYTRVNRYISWIQANTRDSCYCS